MRRLLVLCCVAALAMAATAGAKEALTVINGLEVAVEGSAVSVTGQATFAGAPVVVGMDPAGNAVVPSAGTDLTAAEIHATGPGELVFRLFVADPVPAAHGAPELVGYNWNLAVTGTDGSVDRYRLQATRSGAVRDAWEARPPVGEPIFQLVECTDTNCPQANMSTLDGRIEDGVVEWVVPAQLLGAGPGSVIQEGKDAVNASVAVSGYIWWQAGVLSSDSMHVDDFTVPTPTVRLGVAEAGSDAGDVPVTTDATVTMPGGQFVGALQLPEGMDAALVVAEACYGQLSCARATRELP